MKSSAGICLLLLLAANSYAVVLVYDGGGPQANIQNALDDLGLTYALRGLGNPVTLEDLDTCELLVIGWNYLGDMTGLDPAVLAQGITGNILLTGHDADYHAEWTDAASTFLSQAVSFGRAAEGTGLVAFCDYSGGFSYLPAAWGVSATAGFNEENISSITTSGLASGVFTGLTAADMSNWGESYHARFDDWGDDFSILELGNNDFDIVTIAVPEPATLLLFAFGSLTLLKNRRGLTILSQPARSR